jgi:hypothetical protein
MDREENIETGLPSERPWIVLKTTYDVETWIDHQNRALQSLLQNGRNTGQCIRFRLGEGGELFLHTSAEGELLLDVTPEAEWVTPVIAAATGAAMPAAGVQIWSFPVESLTQLILGLSNLIAATCLVPQHDFRRRKQN